MWVQIIYYYMFWETFFQDVRCDGTDISEDIDSKVWVQFNMLYRFWNNVIVILVFK